MQQICGSYNPESGNIMLILVFDNGYRLEAHFETPSDFRGMMYSLVEFSRFVDRVEYQWKNTVPEQSDADRIIEEVFSKGGS